MLAAEREGQVLQVQAHNEMLEEKVRVLTDTLCCHAADAGRRSGGGAVHSGGEPLTGRGVPQPSQADAQNRSPSPVAHGDDCSASGAPRALRQMRKQRDALALRCQSAQQEAAVAKAGALAGQPSAALMPVWYYPRLR